MRTIDWADGKIRIIDQTRLRRRSGSSLWAAWRGSSKPSHLCGYAGKLNGVRAAPEDTRAYNPAFEVTPASLVSAIVTERGLVRPGVDDLRALIELPRGTAKAGLSGNDKP